MDSRQNSAPPVPPASPSFGDRLTRFRDAAVNWVWAPVPPDANVLFNLLQGWLRVFFIVFREMGRDRITLRASALTYTIVLSLVPTLALGTAVLKGLGAGDQMRQAAYRFIEQVDTSPPASDVSGPDLDRTTPADESADHTAAPAADSMSSHLRRAVDQIFDYVERTNFATLGTFGIIGLVLAVLSVLGSIEKSMNTIWQVGSSRPFGRKLMDYLALMILLPITINFALATETTLQSPDLMSRLRETLPIAWLGAFLLKVLPLAAVIATFTILYRFIPNTKVRFFPAFIGGIFGGISWFLVQILYIKMQIGVARYNAIYGSFATLPLLLLWIYAGWLVFLTGAEMAFACQVWRRYDWHQRPLTPLARLSLAFDIIAAALADFHHRLATYPPVLAKQLQQPLIIILQVMQDLVAGGIMRKVEGNMDGYVPVATEKEIAPAEIVELILGKDISMAPINPMALDALQAATAALAGRKLEWLPPAIDRTNE